MNKTFNIYCDESTHLMHDRQPYMVYGYVSIASNQIQMAKKQIKQIKEECGYNGELKWTNVHEASFLTYKRLIEYFFMTDMKFRAVIVDKKQIDETREDYTFEDFYYRMYFQLLHNDIGLENTYNIYMDIKDTCSQRSVMYPVFRQRFRFKFDNSSAQQSIDGLPEPLSSWVRSVAPRWGFRPFSLTA